MRLVVKIAMSKSQKLKSKDTKETQTECETNDLVFV